jgi:5-dehydro-4-deoxyglucarate dehydratase
MAAGGTGRGSVTTAPKALQRNIAEGILSFPASPFSANGELDAENFARHIDDLVRFGPAAIVPAGGAGELFSLSLEEHKRLTEIAVAGAGGVPIIVGAGQGVAIACQMARTAEWAGADGVLLFPPYLITGEQQGLSAYVEQVCRSVSIGVVAYSRNNGILATDTALRLADSCPNLIAVKDGTGDFEALVSLKSRAGDRLTLINGVPTAEIIVPQCFALGIRSYTSAVFTFLPAVALRFLQAVREGDRTLVDRLLGDFYVPLGALRGRKRGYAVAIVKAGLRATGRPAGAVRPPLVDLSPGEEDELAALIERAREIIEAGAAARPAAVAAVG